MKKLIISKTLLFIFIVLFVAAFKAVFGDANTLIGVTIIIAILMYLEMDLTAQPWKNFFFLLGVNLLQGVFAYIAVMNVWLGIPLNFIAMFIVGYFFTFNMNKQLYIAFGLQYLFILATPVTLSELPIRLIALAFGAVIVMVIQVIMYKDKLMKVGHKLLVNISNQLVVKVDRIQEDGDCVECNKAIDASIKELRKMVIYRRYKGYYISDEGRLKLKISACLEKIYLLVCKLNTLENKEENLQFVKIQLEQVKKVIQEQKITEDIVNNLHTDRTTTNDMYRREMACSLELLYDLLGELFNRDKKELKRIDQQVEVPSIFRSSYNHLINLNRNSARFTYGIRLATIITIAAFVVDYFQLEQGRWMLYTIFSVTQVYSEQAKFRFKERIIGTLIGIVIFISLFSIFTSVTARSLVVLLFGYLNSYAVLYRNVVITVTVCALGTAALISDPQVVTIERIIYIFTGVLIGLIGNQLILPHSVEKGTTSLVKDYKVASKLLMEEVYQFFEEKTTTHSINNLFAITSFIDDRILLNNNITEWKNINDYLERQRELNNSIYELFLRVQRNRVEHETAKIILEKIDGLMKSNSEPEDWVEEINRKYELPLEEKIVLSNVLEIFKNFKGISQFKVEPKKE